MCFAFGGSGGTLASPGLPWGKAMVGHLSCLSLGGVVISWCHPGWSWEAVGEEHSHHLVVTLHSHSLGRSKRISLSEK